MAKVELNKVFEGQWENEKVEGVIRKHWMAYFPTVFLMTVIFLFTFFFYYVFNFLLHFSHDAMSMYYLVMGVIYLIILAYGMATWIDYYFDIIIITDQRLISIQQKGLFVREIDGLSLTRVQNVSAESRGFIQTMFNYGTAYVETAGEQGTEEQKEKVGNFCFDFVPSPYRFSEMVMRLHDALIVNVTHGRNASIGEGDLQRRVEEPPMILPTQETSVSPPAQQIVQEDKKASSNFSSTNTGLSEEETKEIFGTNNHDTNKDGSNDNYPNEPDI